VGNADNANKIYTAESNANSDLYPTMSASANSNNDIAVDSGLFYRPFTGLLTSPSISVSTSTNSVSTVTGALVVKGGAGIGGDLYVGGTIYGNLNGGGGGISNPFAGIFTITNTTNSTSTTTGALQVAGGVGIGGNVNISGTVVGGGIRTSTTSTTPNNPTVGDIWYYPVTDTIYRFTDSGNGSYIWLDINGPGLSGPSGPQGPSGAASSVAGPTGPSGPSGPGGSGGNVKSIVYSMIFGN
jgi:hypothetical protein